MQVAELVSIIHYAEVSLFSDNLSILVITTMTRVLFHNFVRFDATMSIRVILCGIEHCVGVGDQSILRLLVARLVGMS